MNQSSNNPKLSKNNPIPVSIGIDSNFLNLIGKKLYNSPLPIILVRELLQNSRDAIDKHGKIDIKVSYDDSDIENELIQVSCNDTGIGMNQDTLVNVFLQIGKSKKQNTDSIGGFGIAKTSIFASNKWDIHTKNLSINSDEMQLEKTKSRKGTLVNCFVKSSMYDYRYHLKDIDKMIYTSNVKHLTFNGAKIKPYTAKREVGYLPDFGGIKISIARKITTSDNDEISNLIIYRIRGLTQFFESMGDEYNVNILVDFDNIDYKPSDKDYPFNLSRESIPWNLENRIKNEYQHVIKNKLTTQRESSNDERERIKKYLSGTIVVNPPKNQKITTSEWQIARLYFELVKIICSEDNLQNVHYGLTYDESLRGENRILDGKRYFLINPTCIKPKSNTLSLILSLYHLAIHEVTHNTYHNHDESFTSHEGQLADSNSDKISENIARLRLLARKILPDNK